MKFSEIWTDILSFFGEDGLERTIRNIKFGVGFNKQDEIHNTVS
jgi:hypothetical protein